MGRPKHNLVGRTFDKWTVLRLSPNWVYRSKSSLWECKCICGVVKDVLASVLMSGGSGSCGCVNRRVFDSTKVCPGCVSEKTKGDFYSTKHHGLSIYCKPCEAERKIQYRGRYQEAEKRCRDKQRADVIAGYGGRCACCGESNPVFLALDHVHGGGRKEHNEIGGYAIYRKVINAGFPKDYQLLCHNCNWAKHVTKGLCPHSGPSWNSPTWGGGPI